MTPITPLIPSKARQKIRNNEITGQTSGMCPGYAQANLCVLPKEFAYDFLLFTQRNPQSCPVLEVSDTGNRGLRYIAKDADIARDIPKYRIWKHGKLTDEVNDASLFWQDDFVSFLIGCSFSFESELLAADLPVRQIEEGKNVPMYLTNIDTIPAGIFGGKMVVSMRPMLPAQAIKAAAITAGMPRVHGAPIHIGDPGAIGIKDLDMPDFGEAVSIKPGEVPVFWCCGVTPQSAVMNAKPNIAVTHAPGHMFICDITNASLKN